jgi:hypothetical protein
VANYASRFATRLEAHFKELERQLSFACELVWCRPPTKDELRDLSKYAREHGLASVCRVLFNSNEFHPIPASCVQPKTSPLGEPFRKEPVKGRAPVGPGAVVRIVKIAGLPESRSGEVMGDGLVAVVWNSNGSGQRRAAAGTDCRGPRQQRRGFQTELTD